MRSARATRAARATFTGAWREFVQAVMARVDPDIRLQHELDKLHEQYRRERASRFDRYERVWKENHETEKAKKHKEQAALQASYFKQRRIG